MDKTMLPMQGAWFDPSSGNEDPTCHIGESKKKKKKGV